MTSFDQEQKRTRETLKGEGSQDVHAKKQKRQLQEDMPWSYQVAVYESALRRNTIAVLDTGSGRMMIALMLIKEFGKELMVARGLRRLIVFLAPTDHLVIQHYETVKTHTHLEVEHYLGKEEVGMRDAAMWQKEVSTHQVMVMTPQILLDALRNTFLSLDMVRLLLLDECHHANGNHPYTRIMKEFYHNSTPKPSVFGMIGPPVIRKCILSTDDCQDQFSELESILDSKIYTIVDSPEMDLSVRTGKEVNTYYDSKWIFHEDLKVKLGVLLSKYDASVTQLHDPLSDHYKDAADTIKASQKQLSNWHSKICFCLDQLGLLCSIEATEICIEALNLPYSANMCDFDVKNKAHCKSFLEETLLTIKGYLSDGHEVLLQTENGWLEALQLGYISPKLYELTKIFHSFEMSSNVLCLIFVERPVTAKVVQRVIKKLSYLSHFTVSHLTGGNSSVNALIPKAQNEMLDLLRSGQINLLFTTDVAEEGLHIPDCSCVIQFDLPRTVHSYLQSRGRAQKVGSQYVVMLERGNMQQRESLFNLIRSAQSTVDTVIMRDPDEVASKLSIKEKIHVYQVEATGARATADSSVALIHKYCQNLPKDRYFIPKPNFEVTMCGEFYQCTLTFPPNAAFQKIVGPLSQSSHMAKQLVCLESCKKLHQLGALNDCLLPSTGESYDSDSTQHMHESAEGAGTTKRKELHGTSAIIGLSGTWGHQKDSVTLQAYKLEFSCDKVGYNYSAFVLLMDAVLDEDVSCIEMNLYLVAKMVRASISPCGPVELNAQQVEQAKHFHEIFFNGLFGKLFTVPKSSGADREFMLKEDCSNSLWNSSNMYFLLPLETSGTGVRQSICINWQAINSTASVIRYMRTIYQHGVQGCGNLHSAFISSDIEGFTGDIIHLANESVKVQSLRNIVVMAIHTGKIYYVLDVATDLSAYSMFDGVSDKSSSDFSTFFEYFNRKYGLVLKHPGQPLLVLKNPHNPFNLLSSKLNSGGGPLPKSSNSCATIRKPQNYVHMPPELLFHIDVPLEVLKSLYLLPSLMHRMESLMLASQLRKEVGYHPDTPVSIFLILEAITTSRCCEDFSFERLELLGDSVLKYAVSCYLFLKFPEKHEGQLSSSRSKVIRNSTLHWLGTKCGIQGYIRDSPFDPRSWLAPGQLSLRSTPCNCDYENMATTNRTFCVTENSSIVIGKPCEKGHRWICSKTISDCVEAVIGAYFVGGGLSAALAVLRWLGIDAEVEPQMVDMAMKTASLWSCLPLADEIKMLESKLSYSFIVKGLLVEALTHASRQELGANYCYQRLEFLGDSVLDLLITWHLFGCHKDIDPGELTDLRSASVNNENFAQIAVKHNFHHYLQHSSGLLQEQITEYVKRLKDTPNVYLFLLDSSSQAPKVLGDLVESIVGALLIDTRLDLDKIWHVFEPLLSPIVTRESLELPSLRELTELCSHHGYFLKSNCINKGDMVVAVLELQLEDVLLSREGRAKTRRAAKGQAAFLLLKDLEKRGLTHSRYSSKRNQPKEANKTDPLNESCGDHMDTSIPTSPRENESVKTNKVDESEAVHVRVKMQKGGPRTAIYELCKRYQWPLPSFEPTETKPSSHATSKGGKSGPVFLSIITLHIPNAAVIKLVGEERADKKSSFDSAALAMLYELQTQGRCLIEEI